MKTKLIATLLLSASSACLCHAQEPADTIKVIDNATNVTVLRDGGKTIVVADLEDEEGDSRTFRYEVDVQTDEGNLSDFPDNWGMDFPFMRTRNIDDEDCCNGGKRRVRRNVVGLRHLYWGWRTNYSGNEGVKNCFEVGIRDVVGVAWKRGGAELEIGLGFGVRRFLAQDGMMYGKKDDSVVLMPLPEGSVCRKSRLDVWTFQIPILYNQCIGKIASFSAGVVCNFNSYAKISNKVEKGDTTINESLKGLQQNLFTADLFAGIYLEGIGLYASWSPMKMFDARYGMALKGWSAGVEILF